MQNKPNAATDIEDIAFDILKSSKTFGRFPTPVDQIVQYANLKISKTNGLVKPPKNYVGKTSEVLKSALRKVLGALDRREKKIYSMKTETGSRSTPRFFLRPSCCC